MTLHFVGNEEMALVIENMPLVLPAESVHWPEHQIELMAEGHRQARLMAAAFVRNPDKPLVITP